MNAIAFESLANRLGYAGLLPFAVFALLMWLVRPELHPFVATAMLCWGAIVTSFLAGIHWGLALTLAPNKTEAAKRHLAWSAALSFLAWVAAIMPAFAGLPLLGVMFIVSYLVDRKWWPQAGLGHWLTLRFRLSVLAMICCLLGAGAT